MTDDPAALLALLQLADSAFPSGGFALSHGLETLVQAGQVRDEATLTEAVRLFVSGQAGLTDTVALVGAHRTTRAGDGDMLAAVDRALFAAKLAQEGRESATRTGRRLLTLAPAVAGPDALALLVPLRDAVQTGVAPGTHAVVFGAICAALGVGEEAAALAGLHAMVANLTGAALRLLRLDHEAMLRVRSAAAPEIVAAVAAAQHADWRAMASAAPLWEVAAMRHRYAEARLFMS